ncbi:MAG: flagellar basal body-associated FliL family protein [Candidatus Desantisbacteria bacterium]
MECKYIQSQLSSFLDNTIKFSAPIKEHLETCLRCQEELASIKRTIEFTSSIEEILPPVDFLSMVYDEIKKKAMPALPKHNLSLTKRYIIYIILLVSAGLLLAKMFLFKENVSPVISVGKNSQTSPVSTSLANSVPLVIMSKISLTPPRLEEKILLSSPTSKIGLITNPVPMESDIMVFPEQKDISTALPTDITTGIFPAQIPLKPRARVLKLVIDDEVIEKKELEEENTNKQLPFYNHYELGDFIVKLSNYDEVCTAQLRDVVLVYELAKYENHEELEEKRDSIKDIIRDIVSGHTAQEVKQTEKLKKELRERINLLLNEGKILQIGFKLMVE